MTYLRENLHFQTDHTCESRLLLENDLSLCHTETKIAQTNGKVVKTNTGIIASLPESREITFNCGNKQEKQEVTGVILIQLPTEYNTRLGTKTYYGIQTNISNPRNKFASI